MRALNLAKIAAVAGATLLAAGVFAADIMPDLPAAVSILYLAVVTLGSWHGGRRAVVGWTALCIGLAVIAFLAVHREAHDLSSILRLAFSLIAILITCELLLSRIALREAQAQVRAMAQALEARVEERTAELARSEHRFRSLFYDMNIAFAETDTKAAKQVLDGVRGGHADFKALSAAEPGLVREALAGIRLVSMNDAVAHLLGYAHSEEVLALPREAFIEDAEAALLLQLEAIFEGRRQSSGSATFRRKDGSRLVLAFQVTYPSDWTYGLVTYLDITEQQRAHELVLAASEELARANRVATMGALSTSLAHELNQPITAIAIDLQTCRRFLQLEPAEIDQGLKAIDRLTRNVDRVSGIVRRTREQAVKGRRSAQAVDLCELVRETQGLLQRDLAARGATLEIDCEAELPPVEADRVELQQVLVNLILNAADAMAATAGERRVRITVRDSGTDEVAATVADTGPGIPDEIRTHIFEPFFTTKTGGMGMGLQICRSLIEAFGGTLAAKNRDEGGAEFRFALPIAEPDAETS